MNVNDRVRLTEQVGGMRNGVVVMVPPETEGVVVETDPLVVVVDAPGESVDMVRIPDLIEQQVAVV